MDEKCNDDNWKAKIKFYFEYNFFTGHKLKFTDWLYLLTLVGSSLFNSTTERVSDNRK